MRTNLDDPQSQWISGVEGRRVLAVQESTLEAETNEAVSVLPLRQDITTELTCSVAALR